MNKYYSLTQEQLTEEWNRMKELFLEKMVTEKVIDDSHLEKMKDYAIVISEKWFLWTWFDSIFKWKEKSTMIRIVKVIK